MQCEQRLVIRWCLHPTNETWIAPVPIIGIPYQVVAIPVLPSPFIPLASSWTLMVFVCPLWYSSPYPDPGCTQVFACSQLHRSSLRPLTQTTCIRFPLLSSCSYFFLLLPRRSTSLGAWRISGATQIQSVELILEAIQRTQQKLLV